MDGLSTLLKHVDYLMRLFKLYDAQNCSTNELEISVFKSPRTAKYHTLKSRNQFPCQYNVNDQLSNFFFGLYEHDRSRFLDLKLISTKIFSIGFSGVYSFKILRGMSSRT